MASATKVVSLRLPELLVSQIEECASKSGSSVSDLLKSWILERLHGSHSNKEARDLAAIIIAALSPTIELEEAAALITAHLTSVEAHANA